MLVIRCVSVFSIGLLFEGDPLRYEGCLPLLVSITHWFHVHAARPLGQSRSELVAERRKAGGWTAGGRHKRAFGDRLGGPPWRFRPKKAFAGALNPLTSWRGLGRHSRGVQRGDGPFGRCPPDLARHFSGIGGEPVQLEGSARREAASQEAKIGGWRGRSAKKRRFRGLLTAESRESQRGGSGVSAIRSGQPAYDPRNPHPRRVAQGTQAPVPSWRSGL